MAILRKLSTLSCEHPNIEELVIATRQWYGMLILKWQYIVC